MRKVAKCPAVFPIRAFPIRELLRRLKLNNSIRFAALNRDMKVHKRRKRRRTYADHFSDPLEVFGTITMLDCLTGLC